MSTKEAGWLTEVSPNEYSHRQRARLYPDDLRPTLDYSLFMRHGESRDMVAARAMVAACTPSECGLWAVRFSILDQDHHPIEDEPSELVLGRDGISSGIFSPLSQQDLGGFAMDAFFSSAEVDGIVPVDALDEELIRFLRDPGGFAWDASESALAPVPAKRLPMDRYA